MKLNDIQYFFVFDVESIGLHGDGFAVGWTVVDVQGQEFEHGIFAVPRVICKGSDDDRKWCDKNIPHIMPTHHSIIDMREAFWKVWLTWKAKGAVMFADCLWPVESRFLIDCVADYQPYRNWEGPYPFHDIGTFLLAHGLDPLQKFERQVGEMTEHNPVCDARQSARILVKTIHQTP